MNRRLTIVLLLTVATLIGVPGALAATSVDYSTTIQPIFNASCTGCHSGSSSSAGIDLTSYNKVIAATFNGSLIVIPGNATNSILYQAVSGTGTVEKMPNGSSSLTTAQIQSIADWINQGALSTPPPPTPTLTTITVSPSTATLNVNGTQMFTATALDQNNTPMAGVNISWTNSNTTVGVVSTSSATTDMNGIANTTFTALAPGTTMVNATSGNVSGSAIVTVTAPIIVPNGTIAGTVTNASSGMAISGANVTADGMMATTDANGSYSMSIAAGTYNVTASATGYQTNTTGVVVTSGNVTAQDFALIPAAVAPPMQTFSISGFKINDTNGNGVWDSGEMGIENWNINLLNATTGTPIANTSTDASGFYQFMNLTPGSYNVTEGMEAGFIPTNVTSRTVIVENMDVMDVNFTNQPVIIPPVIVTSFVLTPNLNTTLKGMPISIAITALNGNVSQTLFNGTANINITANNASAVSSPMNVSFTNGNATIQVTSSVAQFVTVTATSATAANVSGSTQVMFADKIFSLSKGWNLISIPNFAEPSSVSQILQNVQNNGVVGFDSSTGNFTTPTDLEPLFGYWINVTADNQSIGFIASTKIPSMPPTRKLFEGWNLIGVSANRSDPDTLSAGELFVDLKHGPDFTQWLYTRLVSFEQPAAPVTFVAGTDLSDATALKQGQGYWLFIKDLSSTSTNNVPWAGKQW